MTFENDSKHVLLGLDPSKLVLGVSDKASFKPVYLATKDSKNVEILHKAM